MIKRLHASIAAILLCAASAMAVPALPGIHRFTQPDGSVVSARIVGDEHFHYYETEAGEMLMHDAAGTLRPVSLEADGSVYIGGEITGRPTPAEIRKAVVRKMTEQREEAQQKQVARRVAPNTIKQTFPTTGTVTGLILLCEFQDVKLTEAATVEHYREVCNRKGYKSEATSGSVVDYFTAQSEGKFTPEFDVFGPITLPYDRAHYGVTDDVQSLFRDAALEADKAGLDFSKYDINDDGFIDFLFVVFAGHGQAQGGPSESIWPAMLDCTEYVFDYFDGLNLGVAACASELKGGEGANLDGIGTICHEFSHILGLADIYDTSSQGGHGMSHYDIMDIGTYNDDQVTPSGYTAMDKFTLGWIEPRVLEESTRDVLLEPFDTTHQSVFIVNPENPDEYYTLENRQQQGWDKGLPGHGLVISYCHYESKYWRNNRLNAVSIAGYEHVRIVAADNVWRTDEKGMTVSDEAGDVYPGPKENTSFTANSVPAALWNSSRKPLTMGIVNIRETEEGNILFDYVADTNAITGITADGIAGVRAEGSSIIAPEDAEVYDIAGRRCGRNGLPAGIYVVRTSEGSVKVAVK